MGKSSTLQIPCAIVTGILHYLFLAVFSWMLCEGVMLYLMLVKVFSSLPKKLWFFLILGYGEYYVLHLHMLLLFSTWSILLLFIVLFMFVGNQKLS